MEKPGFVPALFTTVWCLGGAASRTYTEALGGNAVLPSDIISQHEGTRSRRQKGRQAYCRLPPQKSRVPNKLKIRLSLASPRNAISDSFEFL